LRKPVPHAPKLLLGVLIAAMTIVPLTMGFLKLSSVYGQAKLEDRQSSGQANDRAPVSCTFASIEYPEGTVIQEGKGPEQMCASVQVQNAAGADQRKRIPEWIRTSRTIRERGTNVVRLPEPPPFTCKPKPSSSPKLCSCEGVEDGFGTGSTVDSAKGKLSCDERGWRPATRKELGYTN